MENIAKRTRNKRISYDDAFAVNGTDMIKLCKEGVMKGLSVMLKPHETVIIKLK
jgi:hypothetical protein